MKKIINSIKSFINNNFNRKKIKKFWGVKRNKIMVFAILAIFLIVILVVIFTKKNDKFALNDAYNIYPEEVRKLYTNLVSVSCSGDMYFDIELGAKVTKVSDLSKVDALNYIFSNLDKDGKLNDKFDIAVINDAERRLFTETIKPFDEIKTFNYGNYEYTINGRTITRKVRKCTSDKTYVLHLYGYSDNKKDRLSMDVNVSYLKDGILYDYHDNKLGEYDGDVSKLSKLTANTTYYRLVYYKQNGVFKLSSVEHKNRT